MPVERSCCDAAPARAPSCCCAEADRGPAEPTPSAPERDHDCGCHLERGGSPALALLPPPAPASLTLVGPPAGAWGSSAPAVLAERAPPWPEVRVRSGPDLIVLHRVFRI